MIYPPQAFQLCKAGPFNLLYNIIMSLEALQALHNVQKNDSEMWMKINLRDEHLVSLMTIVDDSKDNPFADDVDIVDDTTLEPLDVAHAVAASIEGTDGPEDTVADLEDGHIRPYEEEDDETVDSHGISDQCIEEVIAEVEQYGRDRHRKTANKRYSAKSFAHT